MKRLINFIRNFGYSNTVIVVTLIVVSLVILLFTFTDILPVIKNDTILNIALVTIMSSITILLVINIQQKNQNFSNIGLKNSGIQSVLPEVSRSNFEELFNQDEKIIILNTWIYNISEIIPSLKKALLNKDLKIEFYILSLDSDFVKYRSIELGRDASQAIMNCHIELSFLLKSLSEKELARVKVYSFKSMPKITLFGSKKNALVGFYWPKLNAIHGPHFIINNARGCFSKIVWEYFDSLETTEITTEIMTKNCL